MSIPDENSLECCRCGVYNIKDAVVMDRDVYCLRCFNENGDIQIRFNEIIFEEKLSRRKTQ